MFLFSLISPCFSNFSKHQLGSNWGQNKTRQENSELLGIEKLPISVEIGSFWVAEAGLEPTTSGLWAAVYITFYANNRHVGAFPGSLPSPAIHWNLPRPLRDNPVWVKTWVKNVALLWVSQTGNFHRQIRTYDTFKTTLNSLFRGLCWPGFQEVFHSLFSSRLPKPEVFSPLPVISCPGSNMGQKYGSGRFPSPGAESISHFNVSWL